MRKHGEATKASIAWLLSFVSLYSLRGYADNGKPLRELTRIASIVTLAARGSDGLRH